MKEFIVQINDSENIVFVGGPLKPISKLTRCRNCIFGTEWTDKDCLGNILYACKHPDFKRCGYDTLHKGDWYCAYGLSD